MICEPFQLEGKVVGFACRSGARKRCAFCREPGTQLCDFRMPSGQTCDAPICRRCSHHVEPDKDFCRLHAPAGKETSMDTSSAPATSTCRSCGAVIYWSTTEPGGKAMPIDSVPDPEGLLIVNRRGDRLIAIHVRNVAEDALQGRRRYQSHFSSCPNSKQHRRVR